MESSKEYSKYIMTNGLGLLAKKRIKKIQEKYDMNLTEEEVEMYAALTVMTNEENLIPKPQLLWGCNYDAILFSFLPIPISRQMRILKNTSAPNDTDQFFSAQSLLGLGDWQFTTYVESIGNLSSGTTAETIFFFGFTNSFNVTSTIGNPFSNMAAHRAGIAIFSKNSGYTPAQSLSFVVIPSGTSLTTTTNTPFNLNGQTTATGLIKDLTTLTYPATNLSWTFIFRFLRGVYYLNYNIGNGFTGYIPLPIVTTTFGVSPIHYMFNGARMENTGGTGLPNISNGGTIIDIAFDK